MVSAFEFNMQLRMVFFSPFSLFFIFIVYFNHIRNNINSLKTSLLKWKPDYEGAAYEYSKAGLYHICVLFKSVSFPTYFS